MEKGFAGVMETFDSTRPIVAAMAVGVWPCRVGGVAHHPEDAGVEISPRQARPCAERARGGVPSSGGRLGGRLSADRALGVAGRQRHPQLPGLDGQAKAARVASDITLKAVELAGTTGYSGADPAGEVGADSKILDIFEGTQQIQQLVVARRLLGNVVDRTEVSPTRRRSDPQIGEPRSARIEATVVPSTSVMPYSAASSR